MKRDTCTLTSHWKMFSGITEEHNICMCCLSKLVGTLFECSLHLISTSLLFSVGHSHSAQIKERQSELEAACSDLQRLCTARSKRLQESLKLQEFYRKAEEEEAWIREKEQIVSSSEVGRGLSHVLRLVTHCV